MAMPPGFGWGIASTPYNLMGHSTSPIIGRLQEVYNIIRIGGCVFCPPGARTGAFAVGFPCANHWTTEIRQLRSSHKSTNIISNLWCVILLTSHFLEAMLHIFWVIRELIRVFLMVRERGGESKFLASWRGTPLNFPSSENTARGTVEKLHCYGQILTKYKLA